MLCALKTYLESNSLTDIFTDYWPDVPDECIGLFCWESSTDRPGDLAGIRYVQLRVRRYNLDDAKLVCHQIVSLLNSGTDEKPLPLPYPGAVIGWPRRMPILLNRDERTATAYAEIALWGKH